MQTEQIERRPYADRHRDSGVTFYALRPSSICVWFRGGRGYEYDSRKPGKLHVKEMKRRAEEGLGLEQILSREPTPEFAAQAAEECQRLLGLLGEPELETIALWKMEGYTVEEIAQKLGYVPRSIKRKLRVIRILWEKEIGP